MPHSQNIFESNDNGSFSIRRQWVDNLGKMYTHFDQTINGLNVYGTRMIMHTNNTVGVINSGNDSSHIYGVTGNLATDNAPIACFGNE